MEKEQLMHPAAKHTYLIASLLLAFILMWRMTDKKDESPNFIQLPKTEEKKHIDPIKPITNNYPVKIIYQTIIDTSRRKEVEKQTIITGVEIKGNEVSIQKIDTAGHVTEETHKIEEGSNVLIDNKNFQEKKRTKAGKFIRKVSKVARRGLEVAGAVAIVYVLLK